MAKHLLAIPKSIFVEHSADSSEDPMIGFDEGVSIAFQCSNIKKILIATKTDLILKNFKKEKKNTDTVLKKASYTGYVVGK